MASGDMDEPLGTIARPLWRGRLHAIALWVSSPVLALLIRTADGARARWSVVVFAISLCSMFAVSATYHRWVHTLRHRAIWRRADHAVIFFTIGGTFTPICLLGISPGLGMALLVVMWCGCALGMIMKVAAWRHQRIAGGVMYITLGWVGVVAIPSLWRETGVLAAVLFVLGGLSYTIGAWLLYRRRPTLRPGVFSYHEVWHACTLLAAGLHIVVLWMLAG